MDKLKTVTSTAFSRQLVGWKASMVDPRIKVTMSTDDPSAESKLRAVWNSSKMQFEMLTVGDGVRSFELDESYAGSSFGSEDRSTAVAYNEEGGWIWSLVNSGL